MLLWAPPPALPSVPRSWPTPTAFRRALPLPPPQLRQGRETCLALTLPHSFAGAGSISVSPPPVQREPSAARYEAHALVDLRERRGGCFARLVGADAEEARELAGIVAKLVVPGCDRLQ